MASAGPQIATRAQYAPFSQFRMLREIIPGLVPASSQLLFEEGGSNPYLTAGPVLRQ